MQFGQTLMLQCKPFHKSESKEEFPITIMATPVVVVAAAATPWTTATSSPAADPATNTTNNSNEEEEAQTTLDQIDQEFQQLECLGHGGFGSVYLAKKKSGRKVALKFMRFDLDSDVEEEMTLFQRELDAVLQLECSTTDGNRDLSIVFFEDWFTGPGYAAIVMQYCNGGTLAQEIVSKSEPYSERRIAWYALQLCEALSHAHQCGVVHHDVKSANVLIDRTAGGKLLLADFGSAIAPGEESIKLTEIYAPPELQSAFARDDFSGLEGDKIDSFGLGCIIFEMLCCKKLVELTGDQTLAEFIVEKQSVDAALDLPCVCLPWETTDTNSTLGGPRYSNSLRGFVRTLLEPRPNNRWSPTDLQKPLRQDPLSPLLAEFVSVAQTPLLGAPVTVDNVQLGMFVQRGLDWHDEDSDGGVGSMGVVVKLDADAGYTEVAFPSRGPLPPKPMICRIGANNKYELKIGSLSMTDFFANTETPKGGGLIYSADTSNYSIGQMINDNCMVVGLDHSRKQFFVAPMEKTQGVPSLSVPPIPPTPPGLVDLRKPKPPPELWSQDLGVLVEVTDVDEMGQILEPFYAVGGGLDIQGYEIISVKRIQSDSMWTSYARAVEQVAQENWGISNEQRLFHGAGMHSAESLLQNPDEFYHKCSAAFSGLRGLCFSRDATFGDKCSHTSLRSSEGAVKQMIMSRVCLGRVDDRFKEDRPTRPPNFSRLEYHSILKPSPFGDGVYTISNPFQAYPEYIINYKAIPLSGRRVVRVRRPSNRNRSSRSSRVRPVTQRPREQEQIIPLFSSMNVSRVMEATSQATASPPLATPAKTRNTEEQKTPGSATKMCVVCLERPVNHMLIPCGHPCLCSVCATRQGLAKLKRKCPECRATIREALRFYGKVVED